MQEFEIMKKAIMNIATIVALGVPCGIVFTDSITLQFLGLVYTIEYVRTVIIPVAKKIKNRMSVTL